ncbi:SDR family NAD(P)-dependent oxidoreductase [Microbacterium sp.]|uniref:SDR family NAD(P)-dependent oxidoreductase n=1 Tax=Microbacterium sp. TaxID=51671 RepID=UPI003F6E5169
MRSTALDGRTALVFGAAGARGVSVATTLADLGARVIVADPDGDALEAHYLGDGRFDIRPFAVVSGRDLGGLASTVAVADVLVHCAAVGTGPTAHDRDGGVSSCFDAIRSFAPAMAARRRGSIIAISSPRPTCAGRGDGPTSTSREPLHQMVGSLATEMRSSGVRVNAISPRGVDPSAAVAFLASDASAHITGAVLAMEPGWSSLERLDAGQDMPVPASAVRTRPHRDASHRALRPPLMFPVRPHPGESVTKERVHEQRRA